MIKIKNVDILIPHVGFSHGSLAMEKDRFNRVDFHAKGELPKDDSAYTEVLDAEQMFAGEKIYAVCGLFDTHIHGAMGSDICDGNWEAISTVARYEASRGITNLAATTMTMDQKTLTKASAVIKEAREKGIEKGCTIVGGHMEGPFINTNKRGAQNPEFVQAPNTPFYRQMQEASGEAYKVITMAPECEGGMDFIDKHHKEISISLGHTLSDYQLASEAFGRGANRLTHCYNAMGQLSHREPGPIAAAADHDHTWIEIIADGVHVDPAMVRVAFRLFGPERIVMISDSMRATGLQDGTYSLGGLEVTVKYPEARIASGSLAGSVTDLLGCVKVATEKMRLPLHHTLACASLNPAKSLGLEKDYGSIEVGKFADLLLLNEQLEPKAVWVKGVRVL